MYATLCEIARRHLKKEKYLAWNTTSHPKYPEAKPRGIWGDEWYRTRRTDTARVAPNTPRAGEGRLRPRPDGYLSSSFYIVKISLGQGPRVILLKYHSSPQIPLGFASGYLGWLVVFQAKYFSFLKCPRAISHRVIISDIFILQTEDLFYIKTKLHFNKCVIDWFFPRLKLFLSWEKCKLKRYWRKCR